MWRKQRYNYTCYAQNEHLENQQEVPIDGVQYDCIHEPWSNCNLYNPYFMPRYYGNSGDNHVYLNPYYLNYLYSGDYYMYGYDYWGDPTSCELGYYPYLVPPDQDTYLSSSSSSPGSTTAFRECNQEPTLYQGSQYTGPVVTSYGTISLALQHNMRVEITIDKAIRITNSANGSVAVMDATGENCGIVHGGGRVWQEGSNIHLETGRNSAKINKRGIVFTNSASALVYLVDASGTKSTAERFRNLKYDYTTDVFFAGSFHGQEALAECVETMDKLFHRSYRRGDEVWTIAGIRIKQSLWGDVRITRDFGQRVIRASPEVGSVSVSTPAVHMAITTENERPFFVRKGDKRLTCDANGFSVKNGTQKAGFDPEGLLILS